MNLEIYIKIHILNMIIKLIKIDRINQKDSNDGSIIKEIGKKFIKNVT